MKRFAVLLSVAGLVTSLGIATSASAAPPSPANSAGQNNDVHGVVPARNASKTASSGGNLLYHSGGSIMPTNTTYRIYWIPSGYQMSAGYQSILDGFFNNVAADNGHTSNVYYSDTQYYQSGSTYVSYSSTDGGSVVDTSPFPASGCSDSYTSVCLNDSQLQTELTSVITQNKWPKGGMSRLYFIFTPKDVGSCYASGSCAFSQFCAYHSQIGSGSSAILYANQPYAAFVPAACGSGQHPNNDDADDTINVASHEHNEAITDPLGNAWFDRRGYENGDKCAWNFGTALGSTSYGRYNQVIGSGHYYLQQEWSNYSSRCVLTGK